MWDSERKLQDCGSLISDKEPKGDRRTIWKGIRLTPEYRLDSEQSTLFHEY